MYARFLPILAGHLEQAGFPLGLGWHMAVRRLLAQLPADVAETTLRDALCALSATDPDSQKLFHDIFDTAVADWKRRQEEYDFSLPDPAPGPVHKPAPPPGRNILRIALAALGLALAAALAWWWWSGPGQPDTVYSQVEIGARGVATIQPDSSILRGLGSRYTARFQGEGSGALQTPLAAYTLTDSGAVEARAGDSTGVDTLRILLKSLNPIPGHDKIWELTLTIVPGQGTETIEPPPPPPTDTSLTHLPDARAQRDSLLLALRTPEPSGFDRLMQRYELPLKIAALLLLALALALLVWQRQKNRPLTAARERADQPPFVWNIELGDAPEILFDDDFYATANRLRRREAAGVLQLDLPRTIQATIERGGLPDFQFRERTRPPEYLLLLDRLDANDHRAALFDAIAAALQKQEVLLDRFFFSGDLRLCWNDEHPQGLGIRELLVRYPAARLIVLSDGYRLLNPGTGKPAAWLQTLDPWKQRALLSPVPPARWGLRERRLAERFSLLPARLESLDLIADLDRQLETGLYPPAANQPDAEQPVALGGPLIATLRQYYSDEQIRWIAACAVWPSLHFELTAWLGRWLQTQPVAAASAPATTVRKASERLNVCSNDFGVRRAAQTSSGSSHPKLRWSTIRLQTLRLSEAFRTRVHTAANKGMSLPRPWLARIARFFRKDKTRQAPATPSKTAGAGLSLGALRQLTRLEWFVQGSIPDRDRLTLLDWLEQDSPGLLRRLQAALYRLLSAQPAPEPRSAAYPGYRMHLALLGWMSADDPAERERLAAELRRLAPFTHPDVTALKTLRRRRTAIDALVPPALRRHLHPGGFPALGWTPFWRDAGLAFLLWLGVACAAALWRPQPPVCAGDTAVFQNQTLCLQTAADRALYRERLACDTLNDSTLSFPAERYRPFADSLLALTRSELPPGDSARTAFERYLALARYNRGAAQTRLADSLKNSGYTGEVYQNYRSSACRHFELAAAADSNLNSAALARARAWCAGNLSGGADPQARYADARTQYLVQTFRNLFARKGYAFEENYPNIIGFRKTTDRTPDAWEDYLLALWPDAGGTWRSDVYRATTMPGRSLVLNPLNSDGAAMIAPGQYRNAYTPGTRRQASQPAPALRQTGNLTIYRDKNKSFSIDDGDPSFSGNNFSLDIHSITAATAPAKVGGWSGGAIVLPRQSEWQAFRQVYETAYAAAQRPFNFTLLTQAEAPEAWAYLSGYLSVTQPGNASGQPTAGDPQPSTVEATAYVPGRRPGEDMALVAGGRFTMGCLEGRDENCDDDEKPHREVTVTSFYLDRTEVTNAQYAAFLNEYGADTVRAGAYAGEKMIYEYKWGVQKTAAGRWQPAPGYERHPVVYVTWYGAHEYARFYGLRLPSEAEWEYAARGGADTKGYRYSGSNNLDDVGWFNSNSGSTTHPVRGKNPNELGLFDMSGNVYEWCADNWHDNYQGAPPDSRPWSGGDAYYAVLRGGSWFANDDYCRPGFRGRNGRSGWDFILGFRCARAASAGGQ